MINKTYTWKELKQRVRMGKLHNFLNTFPDKQRPAAALALAVAHWHRSERKWMYSTWSFGTSNCSLCAQYVCSSCPLAKAVGVCGACINNNKNPWERIFVAADNPSYSDFNRHADALFNILVDLYRTEWEKL